MQIKERRFMFHGSIVGLAGQIRRPQQTPFQVKGSVAVPSTGGYASSKHGPHSTPGLFSFSKVFSRIAADYENRTEASRRTLENPCERIPLPSFTDVSTTIEDITIANRLTIDKLRLHLRSSHPISGQPSFSSKGSAITGFRLAGPERETEFRIELDNDLFSGSLNELDRVYESHKEVRERFMVGPSSEPTKRSSFFPFGASRRAQETTNKGDEPPRVHGYVACSLVKKIEWDHKDKNIEVNGHIIYLKDFGYIYLGEMFITDEYRQVTLVRVQLGSDEGGDATCAEGEVNGHAMP